MFAKTVFWFSQKKIIELLTLTRRISYFRANGKRHCTVVSTLLPIPKLKIKRFASWRNYLSNYYAPFKFQLNLHNKSLTSMKINFCLLISFLYLYYCIYTLPWHLSPAGHIAYTESCIWKIIYHILTCLKTAFYRLNNL